MILSVYPKRSLTLHCKKGTKTSNWMAAICSGRIIQVIQKEVVFVSFTKELLVSVLLNQEFLVNTLFVKSLYTIARVMLVLYIGLRVEIVLELNLLAKF